MKIRKMTMEDLDEVIAIEQSLFTSPWGKNHFAYELTQNPFAINLVGELDSKIVSVGCLWAIFERAEITTIGVSKEYQHQGLGELMLLRMMDEAKLAGCSSIFLDVRVSNVPAIRLYQRLGFSVFHTVKQYYTDNGEDAYQMRKEIV